MTRTDEHIPPDLGEAAAQLRAARPELSAAEDDRVLRRIRSAAGSRPRTPVKTRVAIAALFAMGALSGGTGGALALSGPSGNGSAGVAQYPTSQPGQVVAGETTPEPTTSTQPEVLGETPPETTSAPAAAPQAAPAGERALPFTGLAAVPLLLAGVAMLGAGVLLRRRTSAGVTE